MNIWARNYLSGLTVREVAAQSGVSISTMRRRLISEGIEIRSVGDAVRMIAAERGERRRGERRTLSLQARKRMSDSKRRWADANARGWRITSHGYIEYTRGEHAGKMAHRVVAEQMLGRKLGALEHVHHIDFDRKNNSPSNLCVMAASAHIKLHRTLKQRNRDLATGRFSK